MPQIDITILKRGDPPPLENRPGRFEIQSGDRPIEMHILEGGTSSGKPSVMILVQKDDGTWFVFETTGKLFVTAAGAVQGAAKRWGIDL